ncbi:MAG: cysteine--tRNA ligase [bacterium]
MSLRIYNTLNSQKEEFAPRRPGEVSMYVCGVTVYDDSHLGHARGSVVFDVIRRYLEFRGYTVNYVKNFTDIDDKIIQRANEKQISIKELTEHYIDRYHQDMANLGVRQATVEPKATDHIPGMIEMIEKLEEKGLAYELEGDVYFAVNKYQAYGKLSGRDLEEMVSGARVGVDSRKRNPMDFALWKRSKPREPSWDSPWGRGRPGWHIECSVMSLKYLGEGFDIHGGGQDLIFPHHENEIAQAEGSSDKPFARYWLHNGFVNVDSEKMSKSLGNFFTIKEILNQFPAEQIRFFLLSTHYRSPIDFSDQHLKEAGKGLERFTNSFRKVEQYLMNKDYSLPPVFDEAGEKELSNQIDQCLNKFVKAMDDDFNTASAIGELFHLVRELNTACDDIPSSQKLHELLSAGAGRIKELGQVLGLFNESHDRETPELLDSLWELASEFASYTETREMDSLMKRIIDIRSKARQDKDWAASDRIRQRLKELGIKLEDHPAGTSYMIDKR